MVALKKNIAATLVENKVFLRTFEICLYGYLF